MSTAANTAVLRFLSDTNERIQITIPRARMAITESEARGAMDAMIAGNTILTGFGRPAAINSAELVTVERTALWNA